MAANEYTLTNKKIGNTPCWVQTHVLGENWVVFRNYNGWSSNHGNPNNEFLENPVRHPTHWETVNTW